METAERGSYAAVAAEDLPMEVGEDVDDVDLESPGPESAQITTEGHADHRECGELGGSTVAIGVGNSGDVDYREDGELGGSTVAIGVSNSGDVDHREDGELSGSSVIGVGNSGDVEQREDGELGASTIVIDSGNLGDVDHRKDGELGSSIGSIIAIDGGSEPESSQSRPRAKTEGHPSPVAAVGGTDESQLKAYMPGSIDEQQPKPSSRSRHMTEMPPSRSGAENRTRLLTEPVRAGLESTGRGMIELQESRWMSDPTEGGMGLAGKPSIITPINLDIDKKFSFESRFAKAAKATGSKPSDADEDFPKFLDGSDTGSGDDAKKQPPSSPTGKNRQVSSDGGGSSSIAEREALHASTKVADPLDDAERQQRRRNSNANIAEDPINSMQGLYIAKTAVIIAGNYLAIQLLISFEEVFLPFIFAALLVIILEPFKRFVMRVFNRSALAIFKKLDLKACIETRLGADNEGLRSARADRQDSIVSEVNYTYYDLRGDSGDAYNAEVLETLHHAVTMPSAGVQKLALIFSIAFCICATGRVLWLTAKIFVKAGTIISDNSDHYKAGADRLKAWIEEYVQAINSKALTVNNVLDDLVNYLEAIGSLVMKSILYVALQAVVSFIFLIYMMWSPIKMDSNTTSQQVFISTGKYLKVKCLISGFTGICVCISLWAVGLDLPAAFGFLAFLCNFLPALGSVVSSTMPCVLAILDVRKTPTQVLVALLSQVLVHFFVDFVVEPVFFGLSVEIHPVVVILGIWFFFKVWGVAGMLLSVPLLAIIRLLLKSFKKTARAEQGRDAETIIFLDNLFEGRWTSAPDDQNELETAEFPIDGYGFTSELAEDTPTGGLWEVILSSQLGQKASDFYMENRLTIEIGVLVAIVVCLGIAPGL